jgi:shikimate kinase
VTGQRIVLVGSMGSGKTTIGRALAVRLGWRYWDNDAELRRVAGREAADVVATEGADRLHAIEADVFAEALAAPPPVVVSAPGSAALDPALPERLAGEYVVWLRARPDTLAARVAAGPERPFVTADPAAVAALDAVRRPVFAAVATIVVDVDDAAVEDVVERIVSFR